MASTVGSAFVSHFRRRFTSSAHQNSRPMTAKPSEANVAIAVQVVPLLEYCAPPLESATKTRCTPSKLDVKTATFSTATPAPKSLTIVHVASESRRRM